MSRSVGTGFRTMITAASMKHQRDAAQSHPLPASRSCSRTSARRAGSRSTSRDPEAGRHGHAVGRSRRRQDDVRPRADPLSRRRRDARGAEPDLHADADLRTAALRRGACRPLPRRRSRASWPNSASTICRGRRGAARMAGPRRATCCRPTGSTSRSRSRRSSARTSATREMTGHGAFAPRARADCRDPAFPRRRRALPTRQRAACRAMPRPAPTSGSR